MTPEERGALKAQAAATPVQASDKPFALADLTRKEAGQRPNTPEEQAFADLYEANRQVALHKTEEGVSLASLLAALETAERERDTLKAALGSERPTFQPFWEACLRLIEDPHGRTMIRYAAAVEEELKVAREALASATAKSEEITARERAYRERKGETDV